MKNSFLAGLLCMLVTFSACYKFDKSGGTEEVKNSAIINGIVHLKDKRFIDLIVNGTLEAEDISVEETLAVNGACHVEDSRLYDVKINGLFDIDQSTVLGVADINGGLKAEKCNINEMHIATEEVRFDECTIGTLVIKKSKEREQKVVLKNSTVQKTITFEADNGTVILIGDSKIEGVINGGKVVN